jgi:hypothetical protein
MWTVDSELSRRVEQVLGESWPRDPGALASYLARLQVEHPELYRETIEAISGSSVPLTADAQQRRLERRNQIWALLLGWVGKQSQTGDLLPRRPRILAAGVVGMLGIFVMVMAMAAMGRRHQLPARKDVPPVHRESPVGKPEIPEPSPKLAPPLLPDLPLPSHQGSSFSTGSIPANPRLVREPSGRRATPRSNQVVIFETKTAQEVSSLLMFEAPKTPSGAGGPAAATQEEEPSSVSLRTEEEDQGSRRVSPFVVGRRLDALLVTGVALIPGISHPVVAETKEPHTVWIGEATVDRAGFVQMTFPSAVQNRQEYSGLAIALDPGGQRPGIPGRITSHSASAVSRIVGATMKAVSDYTQALLKAQRVTMINGWASIRADEPPPLWSLVAARLADVLSDLQESRRPVPITEVPSGTPVTILVLQGGSSP